MNAKTHIERDANGNVILEERDDGFKEESTYDDNGRLIKIVTTYPNGIVETEQFAVLKGGIN